MKLDRLSLVLACAILAVFFVAPLALMALYSFFTYDPYRLLVPEFTFENYMTLFGNGYDRTVFIRTIWLSVLATAICLVVGFCVASYMRFAGSRARLIVTIALMTPVLLSDVVLGYAWLVLLAPRSGTVSLALNAMGLLDGALPIMGTELGILVGLVYLGLGFMVVNIYAAMEAVGQNEVRAAAVLGSGPWSRLWLVTVPLVRPGLLSGTLITFAVTSSAFVLPLMLGGRRTPVLSVYIYDLNTYVLNWPLGAAAAIALLLLSLITAWTILMMGTSSRTSGTSQKNPISSRKSPRKVPTNA